MNSSDIVATIIISIPAGCAVLAILVGVADMILTPVADVIFKWRNNRPAQIAARARAVDSNSPPPAELPWPKDRGSAESWLISHDDVEPLILDQAVRAEFFNSAENSTHSSKAEAEASAVSPLLLSGLVGPDYYRDGNRAKP